jgi:predicted phosphodiesterase
VKASAGAATPGLVPAARTRVRFTQVLTLWLCLSFFAACEVRSGHEPRSPVVEEIALVDIPSGAITLPNALTSVKFAVIGDSGRGSQAQRDIADQMLRAREHFRFEFVLMLGDNIYEAPVSADDYRRKFEQPYAALLEAGVDFYAVLGNHDDVGQVHYPLFQMKGQRYYSFTPHQDLLARLATRVEFFALDTTNPDGIQMQWLAEELAASSADWKICFFHHPLYTSGRYRSASRVYRRLLEPILVQYGVDVAFSGHEHIYQRSRLQRGVQYFVSGGAGSIRRGDGVRSPLIARSYSDDLHFMLVELESDAMHFQAMTRTGLTIDAGSLKKADPERDVTPADTPVHQQSRSVAP